MSAEPVNIAFEMLAVFGTAKLLAEIFERLKQPAIVGEILAGVLLGPSLLGWITQNPVTTALADLGVLFLMFRVGLDVKAHEFLRAGKVAAIVAMLGVIAPFFLGWFIMAMWHAPRVEGIFVGAAMVATSVGITAQVLASKGLLHLAASQIILAAAVIDDILGLIVLAVVSGLARAELHIAEIVVTALLAIAFTVLVAKWGQRTAGHVLPRVTKHLNAAEARFNVAMVFLFVLAVLATFAGVAAIIGAFFAGMALGESVDQRVRDLTHGITELLLPFFLVGIGLRLSLSAFSNSSTVWLAIVVLVAALVSKIVGCGLGGLSLGRKEALRIGIGMMPRGEVGMVVAQLGLQLHVIPQPVYGVVVFMAVATTMIAPPLITIVFRDAPRETPVESFQLG